MAPDTSTTPPLPPAAPPRAVMRPAKLVWPADNRVTWPPVPRRPALAASLAPRATLTLAAVSVARVCGPPDARAAVVPMAMTPPPASPEASSVAVAAIVTLPVALATTWPPLVPAATPVALTAPSISTEPPTPETSTRPVRAPTLSARSVPPAVTSWRISPSAAWAVSMMVPPSATMTPAFVTSAGTARPPSETWVTRPVTLSASSPSPYRSSV